MTLGRSDSPFDERDPPGYCCPDCTSLRVGGEPSCASCGRDRPDRGWLPLSDASDPFLGEVVDRRFLVTKREASGAHATVYRAQTLESERLVALKVARISGRDTVGGERLRERMAREVRAVRMLESSHIVSIHDFIELEGGPAVIVMDYVPGRTAETCIEQGGPFEVERALESARDVARGLATAHDSGLLHRDIKPSNVMIEEGDGDEPPPSYVTDFGVVRMQAASTLTQGFIGTPLYASPEQVRMEELDPRTDVYSLGATLYCFLTGSPPFAHETTMDVMRAQLDAPVPSVAEERPGTGVPPAVDDAIRAMLAKEADRRPADGGEVLEVLEQLDGEAERGEASGGGVRRKPASPGTSQAAHSSGSFTPVGASTSDFAPLPNRTGEVSFDESRSIDETRTGVQPLASPEKAERVGADASPPEQGESTGGSSGTGELSRPDARAGSLQFCSAASEGRLLALDGREGWLYELENASPPKRVAAFDTEVVDAALSDDVAWFALDGGVIANVDCSGGEVRRVYEIEGDVAGIAATERGDVAVSSRKGTLHWRRQAGEWRQRTVTGAVSSICAASGAATFAVAADSRRVEVYRLAARDCRRETVEFGVPIQALALGPSGSLVAVAGVDGAIEVRHGSTERRVASFESNAAPSNHVYFSEGGGLRAVGRSDRHAEIVEVQTGNTIERFTTVPVVERSS